MGGQRWNGVRRGAWVLVAVGIVGVGSWVVTKALGARTAADFDQWVGWANVLALPVGAVGTALVLLDRATRRRNGAATPPSDPAGAGADAPPTGVRTQYVQAFGGGTAQGVIDGNIVNHPAPTRADDERR
ncbi:hypothetical protein [Micromonospora coxensis]|uniref:Uncharacterized protein n=1 Tax=Micromonospora coxensis TaxID=356852 RepID=A0A1C5H011_9ACTN|nr:hypothetical protein [Micromonospora coxensis]SCG39354.1 hypothetical protein GA0070614_0625 [Micromonospora coxensis]